MNTLRFNNLEAILILRIASFFTTETILKKNTSYMKLNQSINQSINQTYCINPKKSN